MDESGLRNIFGRNIKRYRQRKGWTQAKLAEKMGISTNYLSDIETKRGWISPLSLVNLANALEIEVFELFQPEKQVPEDILITVNKCLDDFSTSLRVSFDKALLDSIRKTLKTYKHL
ncbi:MAG: helix-turn-helix domain-containing protein [Treponema sp.]|nr:helix-turn-helix domain-containing protein [Treponema sp.]